ncbi:hypothetical protein T484DRAFT_1827270 [Baffinella frigidus]|nr:hypothetical protein T484DRAFT_1827270 [Cryptophyta sp. CCMP2293]
MHLESNQLQVLPKAVGKLKVLTQLRLTGNQLRWLPDEIGDCVALQVYDLGVRLYDSDVTANGQLTRSETA